MLQGRDLDIVQSANPVSAARRDIGRKLCWHMRRTATWRRQGVTDARAPRVALRQGGCERAGRHLPQLHGPC